MEERGSSLNGFIKDLNDYGDNRKDLRDHSEERKNAKSMVPLVRRSGERWSNPGKTVEMVHGKRLTVRGGGILRNEKTS